MSAVSDRRVQRAETRIRIAARLKALLAEHDLSIRALARASGLARNTILAALRGNNCTPQTLQRIFTVLDSPPHQLEDLLKPRLSGEDLEIAVAYHEATTDVRNFVARILTTREYRTAELKPEILILAHKIDRITEKEQHIVRRLVEMYLEWPEDDNSGIQPMRTTSTG